MHARSDVLADFPFSCGMDVELTCDTREWQLCQDVWKSKGSAYVSRRDDMETCLDTCLDLLQLGHSFPWKKR
jgi:hypothetical protein